MRMKESTYTDIKEMYSEQILNEITDFLYMYRNTYNTLLQTQTVRKQKNQENKEARAEQLQREQVVRESELKRKYVSLLNRLEQEKKNKIQEADKIITEAKNKRDTLYKGTANEILSHHMRSDGAVKKISGIIQKIDSIKSSMELGKNSRLFYEIEQNNGVYDFSFVPKTKVADINFNIVTNYADHFNYETSVFKKKEATECGKQLLGFVRWAKEQAEKDVAKEKNECEAICRRLEEENSSYDQEYMDSVESATTIKQEANRLYQEQCDAAQTKYASDLNRSKQITEEDSVKFQKACDSGFQAEIHTCQQEINDFYADLFNSFSVKFNKEILKQFIDFHYQMNALDVSDYSAPEDYPECYEIGSISVDVTSLYFTEKIKDFLQTEYSFIFDGDKATLPYFVSFDMLRNIDIEYSALNDAHIVKDIQYFVSNILLSSPASGINFAFIDPLKSTNTFAPFNKFIDYNKPSEKILTGGIATTVSAINEKLSVITDHIENVISSCLQSNEMTIREYNKLAGKSAEPYLYLVVMDFPAGFSSESMKQLEKIIESGPRCGVYTILLTSDNQLNSSDAGVIGTYNNLKLKMKVYKSYDNYGNYYIPEDYTAARIIFHEMFSDTQIDQVVPEFKKAVDKAGRIIIDFDDVAVSESHWFKADSRENLEIPIGLIGVDNVQNLTLGGDGVTHHVLIAGSAGSGKTTLLHTIVTNAMLKYSADELEIYMIDFKHGVEFKVYGDYNLPPVKLVAVESKREFGYDVLKFMDREQKRRSELFKQHSGCKNIKQYREITGESMPRIMLIIDEYHELFNSKTADIISTQSAELLQRLLAQGRAFGIHVILATQSIANVGGLNQAIYDLIAIRIALKSTPNEARLILDESADDVKLLTESGMAVYNYSFGSSQASSIFRVAMMSNEEQSNLLNQISVAYQQAGIVAETRVVDEGTQDSKEGKLQLDYLTRCKEKLPQRSGMVREKIMAPFAVDDNNQLVYCNFEDDNFAAYMMGASGSGKTSLLNAIITGLIMNYHPDELELWLLDFKMTEFSLYAKSCPPHVRYILLEKSEELVYDIIDKMTAEFKRRQAVFHEHDWSKLTEVPTDVYMPVIFVIIDEFAQMSEILMESRGAGYGNDYTKKLENLLAEGRSFGFKFIFASQTYNTNAVKGLSETAFKNVQMRFALKNTKDEIRETLSLSSSQITPEVEEWIQSLPPYKTLFKIMDGDKVAITRLNNLYIPKEDIINYISKLNEAYTGQDRKSLENEVYVNKNMMAIDGTRPKTFQSQVDSYHRYLEKNMDELDEDASLLYPGVPRSFYEVRPVVLYDEIGENMVIAGGKREDEANVLASILASAKMSGFRIHVWAYKRNPIYKKYKTILFNDIEIATDLRSISKDIDEIKSAVSRTEVKKDIYICLGYGSLYNECDILGDSMQEFVARPKQTENQLDNAQILQLYKKAQAEGKLEQFKEDLKSKKFGQAEAVQTNTLAVTDIRKDLAKLLKIAPEYGMHFLFCFDNPMEFKNTKMNSAEFKHKFVFGMSRENYIDITGSNRRADFDDGVFLYIGRNDETFTMREHLHCGIPCMGWMLDENGEIKKEEME